MQKSRFVITILLIVMARIPALCQMVQDKFIIITFEDYHKISQHDQKKYYWIVPIDSIKSNRMVLSRLFLKSFPKTDLDTCCIGKNINPFDVGPSASFHFDPEYYDAINKLEIIITKNRKPIQIIHKKWLSGQRETTLVFATPVTGKFCSSHLNDIGRFRFKYFNRVYLPLSNFLIFNEFWRSGLVSSVKNYDYSTVLFDTFE